MKYLKQVFNTVKDSSPILFWITIICFVLAAFSGLGLLVDDRMLMGVNVWLKPLKFSVSTGIYIITVGFLITLYPYSLRKKHLIRNIVSWTLLIELGIIVLQAYRGVLSHYNQSSALDGSLFAAMGILIGINVLIMILFLIDTIRLKLNTSKTIQLAIFMGWLVVVVGSWVGGQMIGQMSHNVGIEDGGAGLPFVNWSTIAGDLRVAHFFGLHGIQILPILAFFLSKKLSMSENRQFVLISILGLLYALWIGLTYYQASQGIALMNL